MENFVIENVRVFDGVQLLPDRWTISIREGKIESLVKYQEHEDTSPYKIR